MRAAFDAIVDVYWGPNSAFPGLFKGTIAARLVPNTRCTFSDFPGGFPASYMTSDSNLPIAGLSLSATTGQVTVDFDAADVFVVSGSGETGTFFMKQGIAPFAGAPYFRYFVLP